MIPSRITSSIAFMTPRMMRRCNWSCMFQMKPQRTSAPKTSVANYFSFLRDRETRRIRHLMREGREAALVGVAFLAACTVGAQALKSVHGGALFSLLAEGLLIIGWVANWRAVSIFLYEWRPMRRKMKDYDRLASLDVQIQPVPI